MHRLIEDLLGLSKIVRADGQDHRGRLGALPVRSRSACARARLTRAGEIVIAPNLVAEGDPGLIRIVLENLLSNAWKFTSKREHAHIELDTIRGAEGDTVYRVKDNGRRLRSALRTKLFGPFQRCHRSRIFRGRESGWRRFSASCIGTAGRSRWRRSWIGAPAFISRCRKKPYRGAGTKKLSAIARGHRPVEHPRDEALRPGWRPSRRAADIPRTFQNHIPPHE